MSQTSILAEIAAERERQVSKWGRQSHISLAHWALILAEEVGEVAAELCKIEVPPPEARRGPGVERARAELIQAAAVAVAIVEHIDEHESDERR